MLVFDGVFLLRPELRDAWDFAVFLSVDPDERLRRARRRDVGRLGSPAEVERRYRARYLPGQELYVADARPAELADVIVYNDNPRCPSVTFRR